MNNLNVTVSADKTITVDTMVLTAGDVDSINLEITVPVAYTAYIKKVDYENINAAGRIVASSTPIAAGTSVFDSIVPSTVLVEGSMQFQVVCTSGTEVWKSRRKALKVEESIT